MTCSVPIPALHLPPAYVWMMELWLCDVVSVIGRKRCREAFSDQTRVGSGSRTTVTPRCRPGPSTSRPRRRSTSRRRRGMGGEGQDGSAAVASFVASPRAVARSQLVLSWYEAGAVPWEVSKKVCWGESWCALSYIYRPICRQPVNGRQGILIHPTKTRLDASLFWSHACHPIILSSLPKRRPVWVFRR